MSPFRILFVCMGNICRSPTGECAMRDLVEKEGESHLWEIDSAGTIDLHRGNSPDPRMRSAGEKRGLAISGAARQVRPDDLLKFDLVLAMDRDNLDDIRSLDPDGRFREKVKLFRDFCSEFERGDVPDPYYGGPEGFDLVLDIIADGCRGILEHVRNRRSESLG